MKIITTIADVREHIKTCDCNTIGLVPTMGALHRGHLNLVEKCSAENDITVVSIFVNPAQFGPNEDFDRYPRDLKRDEAMLEEMGVDIVFYPTTEEIYPAGFSTYVDMGDMGKVLCGKSRPTHFRGVATVVLKLFNIVAPDYAYFGRKDAQQVLILKRMVRDLNVGVTIKTVPIIRDEDGLALSSRNIYLSPVERESALNLPRGLVKAKEQIENGLRDALEIKKLVEEELKKNPLNKVDYIETVTLDTLENYAGREDKRIDINNTLVAAAVRVGKTRLIDNFILGEV